MGPIGERLDDALRAGAIEQLEVRVLEPRERIVLRGQPVPGLVIVGVGALELAHDGAVEKRLLPGDFLFGSEVLGGGPAPADASAGPKGCIILFGERHRAHELLLTCPPLLEILGGL